MRRALTVALAAAKLVWVAQPGRARIGEGLLIVRSGAVLEAPTLIAGLDDVAVVGETIEECGGHLWVTGHLWMPQRLTGESLRSGSLTRIIRCMAAAFRSANDALDEGRR